MHFRLGLSSAQMHYVAETRRFKNSDEAKQDTHRERQRERESKLRMGVENRRYSHVFGIVKRRKFYVHTGILYAMELVICYMKKLRLTKLYSICISAQMVTNFSLCSQCVSHWQKHTLWLCTHATQYQDPSESKRRHYDRIPCCSRLFVAFIILTQCAV